jgi:hypothetical protein
MAVLAWIRFSKEYQTQWSSTYRARDLQGVNSARKLWI